MTRIDGGTTPIGVVLVHGFLGSPADLAPLAAGLALRYGADAVSNIRLPGHDYNVSPAFDQEIFLAELARAIDEQRAQGRHLILVGHSTGGSLLLAEIARRLAHAPASLEHMLLLVLCATPPRIDLGYTQRWRAHTSDRALGACRTLVVDSENRLRRGQFLPDSQPHSPAMGQEAGEKWTAAVDLQPTIPKSDRLLALHDVGGLVALVNGLARRGPLAVTAPVLIIHGEADELVPVTDIEQWRDGRLTSAQRHVRVAGARHHLFTGKGANLAIDALCRAIDDARRRAFPPSPLFDLEPGLEVFHANWPDSLSRIENSPAGLQAMGRTFEPEALAECEPTLANIEITTRCTLGCVSCARTRLKLQSRFMSLADFRRVLAQLPHAWRINLVGLGEPLLHPEAVPFIKIAVATGRRVSLVTNAMNLDGEMARALCTSGLASITFSLDAVDQATAARVRQGSDMALISANIRGFIEEKRRRDVKLGTAVFTALSMETIGELEAIIDFAADHEIDAVMVTDLNFPSNQTRSLHHAFTPDQAHDFSTRLRHAIRHALSRRLPVLSVWGLEEFALDQRYLDYLLLRGEQLAHRSRLRANCLSPWQTIPVNVDGYLTICDCQPGTVLGNIHNTTLSHWWNGPGMIEQRRRMLSDNPPEACRVCPRF